MQVGVDGVGDFGEVEVGVVEVDFVGEVSAAQLILVFWEIIVDFEGVVLEVEGGSVVVIPHFDDVVY